RADPVLARGGAAGVDAPGRALRAHRLRAAGGAERRALAALPGDVRLPEFAHARPRSGTLAAAAAHLLAGREPVRPQPLRARYGGSAHRPRGPSAGERARAPAARGWRRPGSPGGGVPRTLARGPAGALGHARDGRRLRAARPALSARAHLVLDRGLRSGGPAH